MARILMTVPPLVGHLNPALAVATELQRRGHTVAWAVHMDKLPDLLPKGAVIYPLAGIENLSQISTHGVRGLESVRLFFEDYTLPMARRSMPGLHAAITDFEPDLMVVDHQMPAGAIAARAARLPWVTLVTTSASILKLSDTLDEWVVQQYNTLLKEYLPDQVDTGRPDFSPHTVIVFSVEEMLGEQHEKVDAPYVFVGPTRGEGRREVEFPWDWLQPDSQKILISLGTISKDRDTRFFEVMMKALADMPTVQAVMVAPQQVAELAPPNVLVRDFVPQLKLLPHLDAVICHAGHNTVCEALLHKLPLGLAPIRDDQPVIARQVIDAGAGLFIRHGKVTPNMARDTIERLLNDPDLREAADSLGEALQQSLGAPGAASSIEQLMTQLPCTEKPENNAAGVH